MNDFNFDTLTQGAEKTKAYHDEMMRLELEDLLCDMDVPDQRINDYGWLRRNLGINNSNHPQFRRAMDILKKLP